MVLQMPKEVVSSLLPSQTNEAAMLRKRSADTATQQGVQNQADMARQIISQQHEDQMQALIARGQDKDRELQERLQQNTIAAAKEATLLNQEWEGKIRAEDSAEREKYFKLADARTAARDKQEYEIRKLQATAAIKAVALQANTEMKKYQLQKALLGMRKQASAMDDGFASATEQMLADLARDPRTLTPSSNGSQYEKDFMGMMGDTVSRATNGKVLLEEALNGGLTKAYLNGGLTKEEYMRGIFSLYSTQQHAMKAAAPEGSAPFNEITEKDIAMPTREVEMDAIGTFGPRALPFMRSEESPESIQKRMAAMDLKRSVDLAGGIEQFNTMRKEAFQQKLNEVPFRYANRARLALRDNLRALQTSGDEGQAQEAGTLLGMVSGNTATKMYNEIAGGKYLEALDPNDAVNMELDFAQQLEAFLGL